MPETNLTRGLQRPEDDDVEGHVAARENAEEEEDDVEGHHQASGARPDDDTETRGRSQFTKS